MTAFFFVSFSPNRPHRTHVACTPDSSVSFHTGYTGHTLLFFGFLLLPKEYFSLIYTSALFCALIFSFLSSCSRLHVLYFSHLPWHVADLSVHSGLHGHSIIFCYYKTFASKYCIAYSSSICPVLIPFSTVRINFNMYTNSPIVLYPIFSLACFICHAVSPVASVNLFPL